MYVTGYFQSPTITFGTTTLTPGSAGFSHIFITKYDALGNVLWAKSDEGFKNAGNSVSTDAGGNVYVTGYFDGYTTFGTTTLTNSGSNNDVFIAKLSVITGIVEESNSAHAIQIYPNPASNVLTVRSALKNNSVKITNTLGQLVYKTELFDEEIKLNISELPPGVYFLERTADNSLSAKKFIKE